MAAPQPVHVHVIVPIVGNSEHAAFLRHLEPLGLKITQSYLEAGPPSIECDYDDALCTPGVIANGIAVQEAGAQAIVVACMADPGVKALREKLDIPVFGPGQTSYRLASEAGKRFAILSPLERLKTLFEENVAHSGIAAERLVAVETIDLPVHDLREDAFDVVGRIADGAVQAVKKGADTIIMGCTAIKGKAADLNKELKKRGYDGVQIIDPMPTTVLHAATFVRLGLSHSKKAYPSPPLKPIAGFPDIV